MPLPPSPIPNLNVAPPDVAGNAMKMGALQDMLMQRPLIPLAIQEKQQQLQQQQQMNPLEVQQAQLATQKQQMELDSQKKMMEAIATGALNKYAGQSTPDGTGFDAAGAYSDLIKNGVLPEHANQVVSSFQGIAAKNAEIRKNMGEAGASYLKSRNEAHEQMAKDISSVMDLPANQQDAALQILKANYARTPLPGVDPNDLALLQQADPGHLKALASVLKLDASIDSYHAEQAQKAKETRGASAPGMEQVSNAVNTINAYAAIPQNMRIGLVNELKAAPDLDTMQKVQARADAANESFQRSADARAQAMALKDVATHQVVAGKLVAEDEKLGSALDQTAGIRSLLNMSKGGNETATNAALTRFAEHEIVEGGVKRMNQTEYENLATKLGSYGRKFSAWVDGGFKGQMPEATNAEIGTILDAEDTAANTTHERNVGYVMDRYGKPAEAPKSGNAATAAPPKAATVMMRAPNGQTKAVPADQVDHYKSMGATIVK